MFFPDQRRDIGLDRVLIHHQSEERVTVVELEPLHLLVESLRIHQIQLRAEPGFPQQTEEGFIRERIQKMSAVHIDQDLSGIRCERTDRMQVSVFR